MRKKVITRNNIPNVVESMSDIVIKNGRIVDGTGNSWFRANISIKNGKIEKISRSRAGEGESIINAKDLVISPGFIDLHTHSDGTIMMHPLCDSSLKMGVTTEAVGNCGGAAYAFTEEYALRQKVDWTTLGEWRERVESKGIGHNIAPFCGHNTIRNCVMGYEGEGGERPEPSEKELERMKKLVAGAMEDGAFGMTTGLRYAPGRNAYTEEVIELCRVVAKYDGCYMSHIRDEHRRLIEAVWEFLETCEKANIRGCISHHKANTPGDWGKAHETIRLIENARERGIEVIIDQYPWRYSSTRNLGRWFLPNLSRNPALPGHYKPKEEISEILKDLKDTETWERMKREANERRDADYEQSEKRKKTLLKRGLYAGEIYEPIDCEAITYSKNHPEFVGKRFFNIAKDMGTEDFWEAIRKLYIDDEGQTFVGGGGMCEDDVLTILKCPLTSPSTDSSTRDYPPSSTTIRAGDHPRSYGSYPRILEKYVREKKVLTLEEAIRKMTSLPASFLGLTDRGLIREGSWADITVFNPKTIKNRATFAEPYRHPEGMPYVIVNGEIVIYEAKHTGAIPGKVLIRNK